MEEEDSILNKLNLINEFDEQSIEFVYECLNSKQNETIYETLIQIKNLIIGNNKYKSFYLKSKLINRLIELINDYYINYLITIIHDHEDKKSSSSIVKHTNILMDTHFIDLINQILIIFGSFSLGNFQQITQLIKTYNLHKILFNLIRLNKVYLEINPNYLKQSLNLKLIESCLRALSNLYSSSQIMPNLVYQLDKDLYYEEENTSNLNSTPINLECLIKLFNLTNTTKYTILNIITISSHNLMISTSILSNNQQENELNFRKRSILIKSDFIRLFSVLLTNLQPKIQLNCLKFYSNICFESLEATRLILNTNFYDYSILDLISSYLSRENSSELQLYSAKCLTNLCRSSLILNKNETYETEMDFDSNLDEFKSINFNSQLIRLKCLPTLIRLCTTYSNLYRHGASKKNDLNSFILIETLSTLSYLIELSSESQQTACCLEQVIHIIVLNILSGYSNLKSLNKSFIQRSIKNNQILNLNKTECTSLYSLFYLYYNQFTLKGFHYKQNEHQYKIPLYQHKNVLELGSNQQSINFLNNLELNIHKRLIAVCFQTLACLASNNEESRRVISDNSELLNRLIESIELRQDSDEFSFDNDDFEDLNEYKEDMDTALFNKNDLYTNSDASLLRLSSLCLLHSLSRSVHQLRTRFLDTKLWSSILELIKRLRFKKQTSQVKTKKNESQKLMNISNLNTQRLSQERRFTKGDDEEEELFEDAEMECQSEEELSLNEKNLISILIAILANLLIDFSPCKETLLSDDVISILIDFIDFKNKSIRINSIWALMNLAYKSEQKIKQQILAEITIDKLFQLLTEQDEMLVIKTLGLIRNLICNRSHIDYIMCFYGNKIIQAIIMVLEGEYYNKMIKEQALCILSNIADGNTSKEFIIGNEDLLRKINSFMTHTITEFQVAAVYCVSNLVNINDEGALERQAKLKEIGAHRILQKLLHSNDPVLFEKVKTALQQFSTSAPAQTNNASL